MCFGRLGFCGLCRWHHRRLRRHGLGCVAITVGHRHWHWRHWHGVSRVTIACGGHGVTVTWLWRYIALCIRLGVRLLITLGIPRWIALRIRITRRAIVAGVPLTAAIKLRVGIASALKIHRKTARGIALTLALAITSVIEKWHFKGSCACRDEQACQHTGRQHCFFHCKQLIGVHKKPRVIQ